MPYFFFSPPKLGKIRPIAIETVLWCTVSKHVVPSDVDDSRDSLSPYQAANGIKADIDANVHDKRMMLRKVSSDPKIATAFFDAHKAFKRVNRQSIHVLLPSHAPKPARFVNMLYGHTQPPFVILNCRSTIKVSTQGTRQGDTAGLLFSLTIWPLVQRIAEDVWILLN